MRTVQPYSATGLQNTAGSMGALRATPDFSVA